MKVDISIEMPDQVSEHNKFKDLYEKCCDYISVCESEENSEFHHRYLRAIYKKLSSRKHVPQHLLPLLEKLEDFMMKYDMDRSNLDAEDLFKNYEDDDNA